jgi:hypothetical protein
MPFARSARLSRIALALLPALALAGCDLFGPEPAEVVLSTPRLDFDAVGDTRTLRAEVRDDKGKTLSGERVTWSTSDPAVATVAADGVVTSVGNGVAQISAKAGNATGTAAARVNQRIATLNLASGGGQVGAAGEPLGEQLAVSAFDPLGKPAVGVEVDFVVDLGGGSFEPAKARTDAQGIARARWTLGAVAASIQQGAARAGAGVDPVPLLATSVPGAPARLAILSGNEQGAPSGSTLPIPIVVAVEDRFGNANTGIPVEFEVLSGGGSFSDTQLNTGADGRATSRWTLGSARGTQLARVRAGSGLTAALEATGLAQPAGLSIVAGDGQSGVAGRELAQRPAVRVLDAEGAPIVGLGVRFEAILGGGTVPEPLAVTDANGIARVTAWRLGNRVGVNRLRASVQGMTPVEFTAEGLPGEPASIERITGSAQVGAPGSTLARPVRFRVQDEFGNAVPNGRVRVTVAQGGGSIPSTTVTTSAEGEGSTPWVLGSTGGTQLLRVRPEGQTTGGALFVALSLPGAGPSGFSIDLRYVAPVTSESQLIAVEISAARWGAIITGDLPAAPIQSGPNSCGVGDPALNEIIDDLIIFVRLAPIDGPGRILGSAGPCFIRSGPPSFPAVGVINLDSDDLARLEADNLLEAVVLHEMGHVLGLGTLWGPLVANRSLPNSGGADTHFTGQHAIAAFDALGGTGYTGGGKVPVENTQGAQGTRDSHWRESVLQNELMTGFINQGFNPLSRITIESFRDLSYQVNPNLADAFTVPLAAAAPGLLPDEGVWMEDDIYRIPIGVLGPDGRVIRTIPPVLR